MVFSTAPRKEYRNTKLGRLVSMPPLTTTECHHLRRSPIAEGKVYATYRPRRRSAVSLPRPGQDVVRHQALESKARVADRSARKPEIWPQRCFLVSIRADMNSNSGVVLIPVAKPKEILLGKAAAKESARHDHANDTNDCERPVLRPEE